MNTVWIIAAVMLTAAAAIVMFRILAGPSTLDRIVAVDTLVAVATMRSSVLARPGTSRLPQPRWRSRRR